MWHELRSHVRRKSGTLSYSSFLLTHSPSSMCWVMLAQWQPSIHVPCQLVSWSLQTFIVWKPWCPLGSAPLALELNRPKQLLYGVISREGSMQLLNDIAPGHVFIFSNTLLRSCWLRQHHDCRSYWINVLKEISVHRVKDESNSSSVWGHLSLVFVKDLLSRLPCHLGKLFLCVLFIASYYFFIEGLSM